MEYKKELQDLIVELKDNINDLSDLMIEAKTFVKTTKSNSSGSTNSNEIENKLLVRSIEKSVANSEVKIRRVNQTISQCEKDIAFNFGAHPVATNSLILSCIFGYLDLAGLKRCREVNTYWNEISEPFFEKKGKISFSFCKTARKHLRHFKEDVRFPCDQFDFIFAKCRSSHMQRICERNFDFLNTLVLKHLELCDEDGKLDQFNLSGLLGSNLKTLQVSCSTDKTLLVVPLEEITTIECLMLMGCVLVLKEDVKISPVVIVLECMAFQRTTGEIMDRVLINDFLDLSNVKKIKIENPPLRPHLSLSLVVSEEISIDTVNVEYVSINTTNTTKLKRLKMNHGGIDISCLPHSLECFSQIGEMRGSDALTNDFLPNLKLLSWKFINIPRHLSKFISCSNLTEIRLHHLIASELPLDLSWLPFSVKKLRLENNIFGVNENWTTRELESLYLVEYSWNAILNILPLFKYEHLLVRLDDIDSDTPGSTADNACMQILQRSFQSFTVGKITWKNKEDFQATQMSHIVDKRSNYYCFTNGKGRTIDEKQFDKEFKSSIKF